jgi:two-component system chemotaxis response regulator CheY
MKDIVWVVDDDADVREALRMLLTLLGYDVVEFEEARKAAEAIQAGQHPQILFLDNNLPGVSGVQFLSVLRGLPSWKTVTIVMVSAESASESVELAIRQGADGYVFKPVTYDELKMAIQSANGRRKIQTGKLDSK